MQVQPQAESERPNKKTRGGSAVLNSVLLVALIILVSAGGGYYFGFRMGEKQGAQAAVNKVTDFLNPLNAISDSPLIPATILGKVSSIDKTAITVKMANGKDKKVILTDATKYSKQDKVLSQNDIAKNADVTVFTVGKDKDQTATRVVLR